MGFRKGISGNPAGRPRSGLAFADALRVALHERDREYGTKLRKIAAALVDKAAQGDVQAIREIATGWTAVRRHPSKAKWN